MNVIAVTTENKKVKKKTWLTFNTEAERDAEFFRLLRSYRNSGCGGNCDHFWETESTFFSCLYGLYEKVENLRMAPIV